MNSDSSIGILFDSLFIALDVAKFCQDWMKSQSTVSVRPCCFFIFPFSVVSPESKEAVDNGILVKDSMPSFYFEDHTLLDKKKPTDT